FSHTGSVCFTGTVDDNLVGFLNGHTVDVPEAARVACAPSLDLWHRCFAHISPKTVTTMRSSSAVKGLRIAKGPSPGVCVPCIAGKQERDPIPHARQKRSEVLEVVHWDL
ncbi:hypothetical protein EXIGLDRAFT_591338, partial [Exidia glandulosa HHB12029]